MKSSLLIISVLFIVSCGSDKSEKSIQQTQSQLTAQREQELKELLLEKRVISQKELMKTLILYEVTEEWFLKMDKELDLNCDEHTEQCEVKAKR